jgi:GTP-binding protein
LNRLSWRYLRRSAGRINDKKQSLSGENLYTDSQTMLPGRVAIFINSLIKRGELKCDYVIPSRGLIGFRSEFMTMTSGTGLLYSTFSHYDDVRPGEVGQRNNGVLISNGQGKAVAFALFSLQDRGKLFLGHGAEVYEGQIIGIHSRSNDLTVNCLTGKKLTNMRASGTDEATVLVPPVKMTLEQALEFIDDDELVEVTPQSIRIKQTATVRLPF